jgi:hypothetical protein
MSDTMWAHVEVVDDAGSHVAERLSAVFEQLSLEEKTGFAVLSPRRVS